MLRLLRCYRDSVCRTMTPRLHLVDLDMGWNPSVHPFIGDRLTSTHDHLDEFRVPDSSLPPVAKFLGTANLRLSTRQRENMMYRHCFMGTGRWATHKAQGLNERCCMYLLENRHMSVPDFFFISVSLLYNPFRSRFAAASTLLSAD